MNANKVWTRIGTAAAAACVAALVTAAGCERAPRRTGGTASPTTRAARDPQDTARRVRPYKVVHVFVALCDNANQSIQPVPAALGNGQSPAANLYWGAQYGLKSFFSRSPNWRGRVLRTAPTRPYVLDRAIFCDAAGGKAVWVVAEAYDGSRMREALADFFTAASGAGRVEFVTGGQEPAVRLQAGGWADMVAFVGHNGLMDVPSPEVPVRQRGGPAAAVVLACRSKDYFVSPLRQAGCRPLITTTGLMAPEAYCLDAIVRGWAQGRSAREVQAAAGAAYAKYQRCDVRTAEKLFYAAP